VALQAHPFDGAVELAEIVADRQARLAGFLPVAHGDVQHEILFPVRKASRIRLAMS
jgi:hypothetical protein